MRHHRHGSDSASTSLACAACAVACPCSRRQRRVTASTRATSRGCGIETTPHRTLSERCGLLTVATDSPQVKSVTRAALVQYSGGALVLPIAPSCVCLSPCSCGAIYYGTQGGKRARALSTQDRACCCECECGPTHLNDNSQVASKPVQAPGT